jgi:alpha-beta hydrolase superfamily lysophospholipase
MDWKRILIGKWSWKRPFISLASIYLMLVIVAVFFADRIIFIQPPSSYGKSEPGLSFAKTSESESIAFIHLPAAAGMPTLLYSHGNEEDIADSSPLYDELHASGLGIIAYDYPGYGLSTGSPNEASCQRAAMATWQHLIKSGVKPSSIVITGRSVGSGPAVWLASQVKPAGIILISPFKSAFTTAFNLPFAILPRDRFPNLKRISSFNLPLLVFHGEEDRVIAASHSRELFAACPSANKQLKLYPNAGHNDLFQDNGEEIVDLMAEFAKRVGK